MNVFTLERCASDAVEKKSCLQHLGMFGERKKKKHQKSAFSLKAIKKNLKNAKMQQKLVRVFGAVFESHPFKTAPQSR